MLMPASLAIGWQKLSDPGLKVNASTMIVAETVYYCIMF